MTAATTRRPTDHEAYWAAETEKAIRYWDADAERDEVRSIVSEWIATLAASDGRSDDAVTDARNELPALLEEAGMDRRIAPMFASLTRSSEDDARAEWMLGAAGADAMARAATADVLDVAEELTNNPLGSVTFEAELESHLRQDPDGLRSRFSDLARDLVDARTSDPGGAALRHQRAALEGEIAEWRRSPDVGELLRDGPFAASYVEGSERFALRMLRSYDPTAYVRLIAKLDSPSIATPVLFDLRGDVVAIASTLSAAPIAYEGGRWNGSILAPLLLREAAGHLAGRLRDREASDEELEASGKSTCDTVTAALAGRADATALSLRWAISLLEELAIASRGGVRWPPPVRSNARPSWLLLNALTNADFAKCWPDQRLDDVDPDLAILRDCVEAGAEMAGNGDTPASHIFTQPSDHLENPSAYAAMGKVIGLAPDPGHPLYDLPGWRVARHKEPLKRWQELWRASAQARDAERYRYGSGGAPKGVESLAKVAWATGLHAAFWLWSENDAEQKVLATVLAASLSDAALEQSLVQYVPDPFWDDASTYACVLLVLSNRETSSQPRPVAAALGARAAATPLFFRIARSLLDQNISPPLLWTAIRGGRDRMLELIAEAHAIGDLDERFEAETRKNVDVVKAALFR